MFRLNRLRPSKVLRFIAKLVMSVSTQILKLEKHFEFRTKRIPGKVIRLHLGCGQTRLADYINIDGMLSPATDIVMDVKDLDYDSNTVDKIFSSHLIEHLTHSEFETAIDSWYRMLKPGGLLEIRCPNFIAIINQFMESSEPERWEYINMIFGPTAQGNSNYNLHKNGFSVQRLSSVLVKRGFTILTCKEIPTRSDTAENLDLLCIAKK